MYICIYVYMYICLYVYVYMYIDIYIYIALSLSLYIYVTYVSIHKHTYIYIYIYIFIYNMIYRSIIFICFCTVIAVRQATILPDIQQEGGAKSKPNVCFNAVIMVLKLDGNSEIGANVWSYLGYLICLRHLIRWRAVTNLFFFLRKYPFSFMRVQRVLIYHLIYVPCPAST